MAGWARCRCSAGCPRWAGSGRGSHRPPAPKAPVVQLPDVLGLLTVTWLATRVPVEVDPVTVTQSPAVTSAAVSFTVLVKAVDEVQLTVT